MTDKPTSRPDMPSADAIRAQSESVRGLPGSPESAVLIITRNAADMLARIADALESAPLPQDPDLPVDPAAIRPGDWVAVEVVRADDRGAIHVCAGIRVALIDPDAIRAHYPQQPEPLEWGPVMETEDGEPVLVGLVFAAADNMRQIIGADYSWTADSCGIPILKSEGNPRITGPWRPDGGKP